MMFLKKINLTNLRAVAQLTLLVAIGVGATGLNQMPLALENENFSAADPALTKANKKFVDEHYVRTQIMVPMRDGIKLNTVIYAPRDQSKQSPFLLLRTPYNIRSFEFSPITASLGPTPDFDREGFIFVFQDVRGKNGSEGVFKALTPYVPIKKSKADIDEASDLYDTIDWLTNNIENHNGRAGIWGISADGLNAVHGLMDPHPALKAVSPQASPGDFYIGDDFMHNGAFHLNYIFGWLTNNASEKGSNPFKYNRAWSYEYFQNLDLPLADFNKKLFDGKVKDWEDIVNHPNYDEFWKKNNITQHLKNVKIPVLNVGGWFDVEDFWGSLEIYKQIERTGASDNKSTMIMGPWRHGGWYGWDGDFLANVPFSSKTSLYFREKFQLPFFLHYLKDKGSWAPADFTAFDTGDHSWKEFASWPPKDASQDYTLFLDKQGALTHQKPKLAAVDTFDSDPFKPVPHSMVVKNGMGAWWVMEDQRFASTRPDVLTYQTEPLSEDMTLAGVIEVMLNVETTGTDADWIVKLIDVFPDDLKGPSGRRADKMAGYQLIVSSEILRGRFRNSLSKPEPFVPGQETDIQFSLQDRLHTFKKGHKVMVQIQSSWFPMFDRNPQKYVDNIFKNDPKNMQKSTHTIHRGGAKPSRIKFTVIPNKGK